MEGGHQEGGREDGWQGEREREDSREGGRAERKEGKKEIYIMYDYIYVCVFCQFLISGCITYSTIAGI